MVAWLAWVTLRSRLRRPVNAKLERSLQGILKGVLGGGRTMLKDRETNIHKHNQSQLIRIPQGVPSQVLVVQL